ncbi:MAG: diguanylate cyclase [Methylophaga sp.]|nr:diguanylate cyclase [Methylophaga sp.]
MVLLIGTVISLQQYAAAKQQSEATLEARFNTSFNEISLNITEKIEAYEQMLRATQGLFYASEDVSRQGFRDFFLQLKTDLYYPGLQGIGYAPIIKPEDKEKHIAQVRDSGFPDYTIRPQGEREFFTTILYLEPFSGRNLRAFGYDMASEANRREAMLRARDTQQVALSAGVQLVQDLSGESLVGLLMYLPLFGENSVLDGQRNRNQRVHEGWVYAVFRIDDVVDTTLGVSGYRPQLRVTDITDDNRQVLYQTREPFSDEFILTGNIRAAGRIWQLEAQPDAKFISRYKPATPLRNLIISVLFSATLAVVIWLIMVGRAQAEDLAKQMTRKLRDQNQRLSLAADTAKMGIWEWRLASDKVFVDGSLALLLFGKMMRPEQKLMPYEQWLQTFDSRDQSRLKAAIDHAFANRTDINIDVLVQPEIGSTRMIQLSGMLRFNPQGQPEGILGVSFDITDSWLSQQQLAQTEARWKHALEGSGEGVWDWSILDDKVIFSDQLLRMLGYEPGEFSPQLSEWADRVHPDDREQVFKDIDAMLDNTQSDYRNEHRMRCKDGSWKWILDRGTVIERDTDGKPLRAVGTHSDISWRKEAEIALRQSEERFRNAFDTAAIGMALVDLDGRWVEVNDALCDMLGYQENELLQLTFMDVTHPDDLDLDQQYVEKLIAGQLDHYQMEKRYFRKNGNTVDVLLSVSVVHDAEGKVLHFVSQIEDITARKLEQERIRQLAFYDPLTELPNRRLFDERISQAMLTARRNKQQLALMFIDVDHFKQINDNYGHDIGDEVIKVVADKMLAVLRASDTLARFGGDEFVVLLSDVPSPQAAIKVAENLRRPFVEKMQFDGQSIRIKLSIGVALWIPENGELLASWMKKADIALYDVKAKGRNAVGLYQSTAD